LCDNLGTPNFQLANIALNSTVLAPAGGDNGVVAPNTYSHVLGATTTTQASVSEVGVFTISATPGSYLGVPMSGGTSELVGRFVPAYLGASGSASLTPACGSAFSYQGQWMSFAPGREPSLTLTAYNRAGAVTRNYDWPTFWKLAAPGAGSYAAFSDTAELALHGDPAWVTELAARNARLSADAATAVQVSGADDGDGSRTYRWPGHRLMYQATSQPTRADAPFLASVRQQLAAAQLREVDGGYEVCVGNGSGCQDFSYDFSRDPGSEIRLGRLSLGNAHGSELQGLSLPLRIESWRDAAFQIESADTCSALLLGNPAPVAGTFNGNLGAGETSLTRSGPSAGVGQILLSAPGAGNDGSLQVELPGLPQWLLYDWNGTGRQPARGLASFGIYQGSPPLIFRRELYR
jgi:MSHA biogenesis protein MshQ